MVSGQRVAFRFQVAEELQRQGVIGGIAEQGGRQVFMVAVQTPRVRGCNMLFRYLLSWSILALAAQ